mmetsp:Transcript_4265/g.12299  ORF Transcript_4265/g.12299 Transcript_4265/m.12299 type:complete len:101 (+) Transcript_4265:1250-1552(+)
MSHKTKLTPGSSAHTTAQQVTQSITGQTFIQLNFHLIVTRKVPFMAHASQLQASEMHHQIAAAAKINALARRPAAQSSSANSLRSVHLGLRNAAISSSVM